MIVRLKGSVPKKVKKYKQVTHAMVRTAIKRTKNYLGHTPSQAEFKYSKYTISEEAVNSLFGSYEKAVMSAGLVPKSMEPVDATTI
jgi:Holliday junction resolvasome RuvABC DNA-binding subunit